MLRVEISSMGALSKVVHVKNIRIRYKSGKPVAELDFDKENHQTIPVEDIVIESDEKEVQTMKPTANHNDPKNMSVDVDKLMNSQKIKKTEIKEPNTVYVRWWDGYLEKFEATEIRFGSDLLWLRLTNGENRHIPLRHVRFFSLSKESHCITEG